MSGGTVAACRRSSSAGSGNCCGSTRAGLLSRRRASRISQIVKAHNTVGKQTSGYHGGKKITGLGRHLAVDTEGWLLALVVTAASVSDKAGAKLLIIRLFDAFSMLKIMWADSGYDGARWPATLQAAAAITVEVVRRTAPHSLGLRRRWVIERTFSWLMRYRRWSATTSVRPRTPRR